MIRVQYIEKKDVKKLRLDYAQMKALDKASCLDYAQMKALDKASCLDYALVRAQKKMLKFLRLCCTLF